MGRAMHKLTQEQMTWRKTGDNFAQTNVSVEHTVLVYMHIMGDSTFLTAVALLHLINVVTISILSYRL